MIQALAVIGVLLAILVPFTVALLLISRWSIRSMDRIYREDDERWRRFLKELRDE